VRDFAADGAAAQLELNSVEGTLGTKTPPKQQIAFLFPVPGTGTDDVANNGMGGGWWILKEMPLEQRHFAH